MKPILLVEYSVFAISIIISTSHIFPPFCEALDSGRVGNRNASIPNFRPDPGKELGPFTTKVPKRNQRLLSMFSSDALSCAPQVMCEMMSAKEPGPQTNVFNDYKYLFKEIFLKSESSGENEKLDRLSSKLRSGLRSKSKRIPYNSDSEESSSKSIEIQDKAGQGVAQLMEMEEEDAIENLAIEDMIKDGDQNDLLFALADAKRKQKLQEMAHFRVNQIHGRFKREIGTNSRRKQGRQCRALFSNSESSCSMTQDAIGDLVEKIRGRFSSSSGSGSYQTRNMKIEDVVALIKEAQKHQPIRPPENPAPDVRVVLNIGGSQLPYPSLPSLSQPVNSLSGQSPHLPSYYWPSTTTAPVSRKITSLPNFSTTRLKSSEVTAIPKKTTTDDQSKQKYKQQLFKASKILKQAMAMANKPLSQMKGKIPLKRPKKLPDTLESNSVESLEESSEEVYPVPMFFDPRTRDLLGIQQQFQTFQPLMIASSTPRPIRDRRVYHESSNWLGGIYNVLFKNRRARPLPLKSEEWVPSAIRHSRHYNLRLPMPMPKRPARYNLNYATRNSLHRNQSPEEQGSPEMTQIAFVSNSRINTAGMSSKWKKKKTTSKRNKSKVGKSKKNSLKYKTCCSSPKPKNAKKKLQ